MLDLISLGEDKYLIHVRGHEFRSGETLVKNPTLVVRLLTFDELKNLDKFDPEDKKANSANWVIAAELEESVWRNCVFCIVGHEDLELDFETVEAGFITTVSGLIYKKSLAHVTNTKEYVELYASNVTVFDQIKLLVCRNYHVSLTEVNAMPLDVLVKKYSVIHSSIPSEAINFNPEEEQVEDVI